MRRLTCKVVFLATALFNVVAGFSASNFTETGECQGDQQVCLYDYTVQQQYFASDGQQNMSVAAEVEIMCSSVGDYNGETAVLYCMVIRGIELNGGFFEDNHEQAMQSREEYLLQTLSGRFCFVQTSDGKVPAVFYSEPQSDTTLNVKKGIAAAFQANFKGTEVEEEIDPQSMHRAHYKFETPDQDGTIKMHRSINGDDVIEYSTGVPKRDIKLTKEEDIDYQSGRLQHSAGHTSVRISKDDTKQDKESFSNLLSAKGSYSLDLKQCSSITKRAYSRHRRSVRDDIEKRGIEESLRAKYNKTVAEMEELRRLREEVPSVISALFEFEADQNDTSTIDVIERLLQLEYKYGPLPGYSPAQSDVLEFFATIKESTGAKEEQMREIVYSLFAAEGSVQSQMVLINALEENTMPEQERNVLINIIGMVKHPHLDFVRVVKRYLMSISTKETENIEAEALLLSFGALASGATPDVEDFVVRFLLDQSDESAGDHEDETSQIPLILAMGNTGSKLVVDSLLSYLDSPDQDIQVITIQALRKFTFNQQVLNRLERLLTVQNDENVLAAVIEVLVTGLEYSSNFDSEHFDAHNDLLSHHPILTTLVTVTLETNETKFDQLVQSFLKDVGGKQAYFLLAQFHHVPISKRGTDWDEYNTVYDLVAPQSERRSCVDMYPRHCAYIWGKRFGIDEANLEVAAGVFAGISNDCNNIKVFGRAVAKCNVLSRSYMFVDLLAKLVKTSTTIEGRVYINIAGNTLVDYSPRYSLPSLRCYNYEREFFNRRYRIFRFSYPVYVYVARITLNIEVHATVSLGCNVEICGQARHTELITASGSLTGAIGASVSGGVEADLLSLARGGITCSANFVYQLELGASAQACRRDCSLQYQTCGGVYDSWPGNTLNIETWYQIRSIRWCGGWIRYPCGIDWGRRRTWDDFSWSWSLGSRGRRALYERCIGTSSPQCPSTTTTAPATTTTTSTQRPSVTPASPCRHGTVRLVGGNSPNEGRVEICNQGTWGTVCDDGWSSTDASVVCQQLGYLGIGANAVHRAEFGSGTGSIWLDNVACTGTETRLIDCPANAIGNHNCVHSEDAGVICSVCQDGDVRLVGGLSELEGRVECCYEKEWGTVCDDYWDNNDAGVVCRQLGFSGGVAVGWARFGQGNGSIWLDDVDCTGNETTLMSCPANAIGDHNCGHYEDAGVICQAISQESCQDGDVRLVGGSSELEGLLEYCCNGEWGTVCDDLWDNNDARVVCRQLGFSGGVAVGLATFGRGNGSICLDNVDCTGSETMLVSCQANPIGDHNCNHYEDAGVICQANGGVSCQHGDIRLVGGTSDLEGRVEICNEGVWGTVCDDFWDDNDAHVTCKQLGYSGGGEAVRNARFGQGSGPIWLDDVDCTGNEMTLISCQANPIGDHNCGHYEDAGVICRASCTDGDIRLVGGTASCEGRVEVCVLGEWGTVCDDYWDTNDARVVCRQLGCSGVQIEAVSFAEFGEGSGSIWLDDVHCTGSETTLMSCPANPIGDHNCGHYEDAGVRC